MSKKIYDWSKQRIFRWCRETGIYLLCILIFLINFPIYLIQLYCVIPLRKTGMKGRLLVGKCGYQVVEENACLVEEFLKEGCIKEIGWMGRWKVGGL